MLIFDFYKILFLLPFELLFLLATTNYVQNQLLATVLKLQIATCWKKCTTKRTCKQQAMLLKLAMLDEH